MAVGPTWVSRSGAIIEGDDVRGWFVARSWGRSSGGVRRMAGSLCPASSSARSLASRWAHCDGTCRAGVSGAVMNDGRRGEHPRLMERVGREHRERM